MIETYADVLRELAGRVREVEVSHKLRSAADEIDKLTVEIEQCTAENERLQRNNAWLRSCLSQIHNHKEDTGEHFEQYVREFVASCLEIYTETTKDCEHAWSDPSKDAPPVTCIKCGEPKLVDLTADDAEDLMSQFGEMFLPRNNS